ncbi:hypothetical protein OG883_44120 [Streptomyces sp. NBC_01142]|uniref:hypothetical protein n=1 Tax=Streptomyces sp. NBC_01142 TaxID=2975865 RepID=UPI00224EE1AF|nr:hypothetical protein [Streptomyces sp. NBC_01142]MCX4826630.1 hypothetical protein [Streptomyces sp. NBC_01142]
MDTEPLDAFPSFRLRLADTGTHDVLAADGHAVGQVLAAGGGHFARVGPDKGPLRQSLQGAGGDAVMFHIAGHGLPDEPAAAYSGAPEARVAVSLVPLQRQELIDTTARAFTFYALRQPHVAAILSGLEIVGAERDAVHSRAGCRRVARLLRLVQAPAQALLDESTGDTREWLALSLARLLTFCLQARVRLEATAEQPPADLNGRYTARHSADADLDTLHRIWRDLQSTSSAAAELSAIDAAMTAMPGDRYAQSAKNCRSTAARLACVRTAADETAATAVCGAESEPGVLARELSALASETGGRLEATALVLDDTGRLGTVRDINDALARARLGAPTDAGEQSVRVGRTELGPTSRTADGRWTGPGITEPFHSPEGAAAALVRGHLAQEMAQRRDRTV